MELNIVDLILLVCFIPAVMDGLKKGFVDQIVQFGSLVLGVWVAFHFSNALSEIIASHFEGLDPMLVKGLSFIALVFAVIILMKILGGIVEKILKAITLGWINRIAGLLFSLFKAVLILGLLISLFDALNARVGIVDDTLLKDSRIYCAIQACCAKIFPFLKSFLAKPA